jgi:hypothetical protein
LKKRLKQGRILKVFNRRSLMLRPSVRNAFILILILSAIVLSSSFGNTAEITTVTLRWDPNAEPDLLGYNVYYRESTRKDWQWVATLPAMSAPECPLTLEYGKKYYLAITAFNTRGNESFLSEEVCWPIQLLTGNSGEALETGALLHTEWFSTARAERFTLAYSVNKGSTWKTIAENIQGRSYNWIVPVQSDNKKTCLLRVTGYDSAGKKVGIHSSTVPFPIEVVKVMEPNGGESLRSYEWQTIRWQTHATKNPPLTRVDLYFSTNGGSTWTAIATVDGSVHSYQWNVPYVKSEKTKCMVRVILRDGKGSKAGTDVSDSIFTITP